jgi:hypothetical protein
MRRAIWRSLRTPTWRSWALWLAPLVAGAMLRAWFIRHYPVTDGDPQIYGDIAKNMLLHHAYGFSNADGTVQSTLIRLPGYPLFLAACFRLFGVGNLFAVMVVQLVADLGTCLLVAAFARRLAAPARPLAHPGRATAAAAWTLWLAALCPFTASYVAAPLTETLELFSIALALYAFARLLEAPTWKWLALLAGAWCYSALLRPDGALLGLVLSPAIVVCGRRRWGLARMARMALVGGVVSVLPFCAWAARNWAVFHVFEPLAPRYANDPGESTDPGFQRWTKTVCVDLTCTSEVYWNANTDVIRLQDLPSRAFDTEAQLGETRALLADYNQQKIITPEFDARFAALAQERVRARPFRYYLALPLARLADMWLRPRVELLPIELRWWEYDHHPEETRVSVAFGLLNLLYLGLALWAAAWLQVPWLGMMLAFVLLRSALLATVEAPEPRYTLECFPMVLALAGVALSRFQAGGTSLVARNTLG